MNRYVGSVDQKIFLGEVLDFQVKIREKLILARVHPTQLTPVGHPIHVYFDPRGCVVFKAE
jgi:iron(III) transport system ATP-binding protein